MGHLNREKRALFSLFKKVGGAHAPIATPPVPRPLSVPIYPGSEVFLGLANAKCEKTREEKGKTSGEFVSDSWFG